MNLAEASMERFSRPLFKSVLDGVSDVEWDAFVRALSTHTIRNVSLAGGIGSFDLRPRRLGELGVMINMRRDKRGAWVGDLAPKFEHLGANAGQQFEVFALSMKKYDIELASTARPEGVSRSGRLAILHCGGSGALEKWPEGAFKTTKAIFDRSNGIF